MISSLISRLTILPRWIIIVLDLIVIALSAVLGYLFRFNFVLSEVNSFNPSQGVLLLCATGLIATIVTRSYAGIVRYTGVEDGIRILYTCAQSLTFSVLINLVYYYNEGRNLVPYSVLFISFFVSLLFLFYYRLLVKSIFAYYKGELAQKVNVAIFGAGSLGMLTRNVLETDSRSRSRVTAFIEDDIKKVGKVINGVPIYGSTELPALIRELKITELIIAVRDLTVVRKNELAEHCANHSVLVRMVPPPEQWTKGEFKVQQIKAVNIEDLLGRETIQLDNNILTEELAQKTVMITGAAGSIGGEIARQLLRFSPRRVAMVDQAETPLHDIEQELLLLKTNSSISIHVADITNAARMTNLFLDIRPDIVFHAAAYKHVPMMEGNPAEAVHTNVLGTKLLADLALTNHVKKFVMVSTDKAVNPTSVMGCSKRIAEMYVQSLDRHSRATGNRTQYITTRFGNVLGSNGSVIPTFRKQIQSGGPVTVTHPEITRFFMTIPEACRLVLEAGAIGKGGEVFIFDMGGSIKILDLARKMIRLSGLEPGKDIEIHFTGLREGEKLYEELLTDSESTIPTHHKKILIARVNEFPYDEVNAKVTSFADLVRDRDEMKIVSLMKEMVPEYRSNYSRFEALDKPRLQVAK